MLSNLLLFKKKQWCYGISLMFKGGKGGILRMLYAPSVVAVGRSLIIKVLYIYSFALICFVDSHVFTLPMWFFYPGISKGSWGLSMMTSPIPPLPARAQGRAGKSGCSSGQAPQERLRWRYVPWDNVIPGWACLSGSWLAAGPDSHSQTPTFF